MIVTVVTQNLTIILIYNDVAIANKESIVYFVF